VLGPPAATIPLDVESFSHLHGVDIEPRSCQGLACFVARDLDRQQWDIGRSDSPRVYCLGRCYAAPATGTTSVRPHVESDTTAVVLERVVTGPTTNIDDYRARKGLAGLERALSMSREAVVSEIEASQLRGRGGAGFLAGRKWRSAFERSESPKFVVCNADEGDPGAYVDRVLLEDDPYCVLEAITIAAYAIGAERGYVYVRREYPEACASMRRAVETARAASLLGDAVFGRGVAFDVDVLQGKGSYVCGEETALLNAIEGRRPDVRARPPFPAERGLFDQPTLVHNVETLANVPWILREGAASYASLGHGSSRGTKVFSLNSLFQKPGLFEVELGTRLPRLVFELAGGLRTGELAGTLVGGPLAGVIAPQYVDVRLTFEDLDLIGASLGHGGVIGFDGGTSLLDLAHEVFRFGAYESCGKCTPCRVGCAEVEEALGGAVVGSALNDSKRASVHRIVAALGAASLCGHGTGLAAFARSLVRNYPDEVRACFV
jgi:NADH:ubiquinone oxidoreductase subunit F (NADH-binding)